MFHAQQKSSNYQFYNLWHVNYTTTDEVPFIWKNNCHKLKVSDDFHGKHYTKKIEYKFSFLTRLFKMQNKYILPKHEKKISFVNCNMFQNFYHKPQING